MHWPTLITSSQCSNPDNFSRPSSSILQPCSSQSGKDSPQIPLPKNTSNVCEHPQHLLPPLKTHGHSQRMGNSSCSKEPSTSLIIQMFGLMSFDPTMIIALLVTLGLGRLSVIFIIIFTGLDSSSSSPTMYTHAQLAAAANRFTTNHLVPISSFQLPHNLGILSPWTSLRVYLSLTTMTRFWLLSVISLRWCCLFPPSETSMLKT